MAFDSVEAAIVGSLEGLEGRDADPDNADATEASGATEGQVEAGTGETPDSTGQATGQEAATAAKVAAVEDKLALELGLDPKRKVNNIPYPRVREIVTKREKDLIAKAGKAFGLKPEELEGLSYDQLDGLFDTHYTKRIGDYETKIKDHTTRLSEVEIVEQLMASDDRKFLEALSFQYPQYRKYLDGIPAGEQKPQVPAEDVEPPMVNADGTTSLEMLQKNFEWRTNKLTKAHEAQVKALEEKYKPVLEAEKVRALDKQSSEATNKMLTEARSNWPGFAENEKEILDLFVKDKSLGIKDAYNEIRIQKIQAALEAAEKKAKAGERTGRERTLAELKATGDTNTGVVADTHAVTEKPKSIEDIIREKIAGYKG